MTKTFFLKDMRSPYTFQKEPVTTKGRVVALCNCNSFWSEDYKKFQNRLIYNIKIGKVCPKCKCFPWGIMPK